MFRGGGARGLLAAVTVVREGLAAGNGREGVAAGKVLAWIRSGELRAFDAALRAGGRHRYLIDEADVLAFEAPRAGRRRADGVTEYH